VNADADSQSRAGDGGVAATAAATVDDRPELLVAGAFIGGLALAFVLRQVAGD
jgi:hypothetical protein